jgi:hypothetical protein
VVSCIGDSELKPQSCAARAAISRDAISLQDQSRSLWRTRVRRFSHLADSDIGGPKGKSFSFASGEVARGCSRPSERTGGRWQRSRDLANSGVRRVKAQVLGVQSREARGREAAKWREDRSRPSEEDRWQRSRDLANSGVRRVRAQTLGTPSREDAR